MVVAKGCRGVVRAGFWQGVRCGLSVADAARRVGVAETTARGWFRHAGGMIPRATPASSSGRFLDVSERIEIHAARRAGDSIRQIARSLGRAPSTISRELRRNTRTRPHRGPEPYRPMLAQDRADRRRARPKPAKLGMPEHDLLRQIVQHKLTRRWSPQQISGWLRETFNDPEMYVAAETIYRAVYLQPRGGLKREVQIHLRTGRSMRRPRRGATTTRPERIPGMLNISQRPAQATDRAVPGHHEGDLILGKNNGSAIGTIVERTTRFVLLLHLPARHGAVEVRDAIVAKMAGLPAHLRASLTWDQGIELARHAEISTATDMTIYFCDPASPWQRGTNENTNGLLREYFPKGTDLSVHTEADLDRVAAELNGRPRKTLGYKSPAHAFNDLLLHHQQTT